MKRQLLIMTALLVVLAGASSSSAGGTLPGDTGTAFWPHETGVLVGTSETYVDVREDGSYFDPSIQRRVSGDSQLLASRVRTKIQPHRARDSRGREVFRSGGWLME